MELQFDQEKTLHDHRAYWEDFFLGYPRVFSDFDDAENEGIFIGRYHHALFVIAWAVGLTLLRGLFNKYVAIPLGTLGGIKDKAQSAPTPNEALEKIFKGCRGRPKERHVLDGVTATGLTKSVVARWFERRRRVGQPTQMAKFCEETWRLCFYFFATVYGFVVLWDKCWFADPKYCWLGFPFQPFPVEIRFYYYIQLGMYSSLLFSVTRDHKRKDFWEHVIHHVVTILLMSFSYIHGYWRIGSLVLICHDVADIFLEAAKAAYNLKYQAVSEGLFIVFAVVFCLSRIVAYPLWILRTLAFDMGDIMVRLTYMQIFYLSLLGSLQVLHLFWFKTIAVMAYKFAAAGKLEGDARSDEELEDSEVEVTPQTKKIQ